VRLAYRFAGLIPVQSKIYLRIAQNLPHRNFGMREGEASVTISASSFFPSTFFLEEQKESGHQAPQN
jgi:hypothetical protein